MKKEDIQRAVDIILEMGPPRGLFLSTARTIPPPLLPKLTVWSPSNTMTNDDPLERDIPTPRVEEASIVLLGTPRNTDHLPLLQDAHIVFVLLRSCLALPKKLAETFGGWHDVAAQQVKKLAGALTRLTGQEKADTVHHLFSRLSVLLMKLS